MICHAIRMWLLGMTAMSVVSWGTAVSAFLVLLVDGALSVTVFALLSIWTAAVPVPVTFHTVRGWQRVRVARQMFRMGRKHARLIEEMRGGNPSTPR